MLSMTCASLGWGTWWLLLLAKKLAEDDPGIFLPGVVSTVFAVLGLGVALLTLRARRSWMLFALIPLLANASLLAMPWLAAELTSK